MGRIDMLCGLQSKGLWLDIVAVAFFLVAVLVCSKRGFIGCVFGIFSTLIALVLALSLAKVVVDVTGGLFGLEETLTGKFGGAFAKIDGFDADISSVGVETAVKTHDVPSVLAKLLLKTAGKAETLTPGTTLATLLGEATAALAVTFLAGLLLFILTKPLLRLLKRFVGKGIRKIKLLNAVNALLGALFGVVYALLVTSVLLTVLTILPFDGIARYLSNTLFVGWLYENNPLITIIGWFL